MKILHLHKNKLLVCFLVLLNQSLLAQHVADIYVNMPDFLNPTLTRQNRLELLEYHKLHQSDSITNRFGNQAHLLILDSLNQLVVVRNTASSTFEMKILKLQDSTTCIGIIRSVCAPVCLSSVEFYDTAWNVIPIVFAIPKAVEWIDTKAIPADKIDVNWVRSLMEVGFVSLTFSSENQDIIAKNNTLDFLNDDDRKLIRPYCQDKPILFRLDGRTWVEKP